MAQLRGKVKLIILMAFVLSGAALAGVDQPWNETYQEEKAADCRADPRCLAEYRKMLQTEEQTQREYEKRWRENPGEAALRWLGGIGAIAAIIAAYTLVFSLGSKNKGKEPRSDRATPQEQPDQVTAADLRQYHNLLNELDAQIGDKKK